jgi:PAS domain S-box-containing protein
MSTTEHTPSGHGELARQSLNLHAEILARVTDGVNVVSANDGRILYVNRAMADMFGYTPEELVGQRPGALNASSDAGSPEAVAADIVSVLRTTGQWQGDLLNRRKDGSTFWTNVTITRHEIVPWGTVWLGIQRDISTRKQHEHELAKQRALLESVMNTTDVMLVLLDPSFNFVWVNTAYANTCGMRPEQMIGKNHFVLYPHAENEAIFHQVRDTGIGVFHKDKAFDFRDQPERGTTYWDWSLDPIKDGQGTVTGLVFSLRETTQFKRIELALAASEAHYRSLVEQVPDGIFVADANGRYTDINEAGAAMLGYSRCELLGMSIKDVIFPEEVQRLTEEITRFKSGSVVRSEWRIRRKDGSNFLGEVLGRQLPDGRLQGVLRDISERREIEDERVAALTRQRDTLVQEVHHRIKNHLHGVMGLLSAEALAHPALAAPLAEITTQIKAIATVYGLQASRKQEQIELGQMVGLLVRGAAGPVPVTYMSSVTAPVHVAESASVPLALVINEMIVNALKHLDQPDPQRPVRVTLEQVGITVRLEVRGGPARLPAGFDFAQQNNIGLGLELVSTLLPRSGARLCYDQLHDEVCATLSLEAPAICKP